MASVPRARTRSVGACPAAAVVVSPMGAPFTLKSSRILAQERALRELTPERLIVEAIGAG